MPTSRKTLNEITGQMWEFLHLTAEAGTLPLLDEIEVKRSRTDPGWHVKAYVGGIGSDVSAKDAVATVHAYAAIGGTAVKTERYSSSVQPSGSQVCVQTRVVLGGVPVEVLALLDSDEHAAATILAGAPLVKGDRVRVARLDDEAAADWIGSQGHIEYLVDGVEKDGTPVAMADVRLDDGRMTSWRVAELERATTPAEPAASVPVGGEVLRGDEY